MNNPHLQTVLERYPDVDAASLPWPDDADTWEAKEVDMFVGSGGYLKPKRKKSVAAAAPVSRPAGVDKVPTAATPAKADETNPKTEQPAKAAEPTPFVRPAGGVSGAVEEQASAFEVPGFSVERHAITLPVRVHCEDTAPNGHVRIESLVAFSERIRSLTLKQIMNLSLADLRERERLAILATEYVCEIVGEGFRVLDVLRVDTTPEFPAAPLFPWEVTMCGENGELYMRGLFALNLCGIAADGSYSGIEQARYESFVRGMRKWCHPDPRRRRFDPLALRFFNAYKPAGKPFRPTGRLSTTYRVRSSDCDMYNVLFQARVPSMMESCHPRHDLVAIYVNILNSVRPGFELSVYVLHDEESALFLCAHGAGLVLTAFAHYGRIWPLSQEEVKLGSVPGVRLKLLNFMRGDNVKLSPCAEYDVSLV